LRVAGEEETSGRLYRNVLYRPIAPALARAAESCPKLPWPCQDPLPFPENAQNATEHFVGRPAGGDVMVIAALIVAKERIGSLTVNPQPLAHRCWLIVDSALQRRAISRASIGSGLAGAVDLAALGALAAGRQSGHNLFRCNVQVKDYRRIPAPV
jgi:hypothetical protein